MNKPDWDDPTQVEKSLCEIEDALLAALKKVEARAWREGDFVACDLLQLCFLERCADFAAIAKKARMSPQLLQHKTNDLIKKIATELSKKLGVGVGPKLLKNYFSASRAFHTKYPAAVDGVRLPSRQLHLLL